MKVKSKLLMVLMLFTLCCIPNTIVGATVMESETDVLDEVLGEEEVVEEVKTEEVVDEVTTEENNTEESNTEDSNEGKSEYGMPSSAFDVYELPDVDTDDAYSWVVRKGQELMALTQTGALYIIGTLFFVALVAVILSFLNIIPRGAGIGTVIVCVLCFIGVYAGPYILKGLSSWAMH